jgi:hypothetical protein
LPFEGAAWGTASLYAESGHVVAGVSDERSDADECFGERRERTEN